MEDEMISLVAKNNDNCPSTLVKTLEKCDKDFFPNIHTLLRIACTLPVTSCECERANSTLKCVKTSLHSTYPRWVKKGYLH